MTTHRHSETALRWLPASHTRHVRYRSATRLLSFIVRRCARQSRRSSPVFSALTHCLRRSRAVAAAVATACRAERSEAETRALPLRSRDARVDDDRSRFCDYRPTTVAGSDRQSGGSGTQRNASRVDPQATDIPVTTNVDTRHHSPQPSTAAATGGGHNPGSGLPTFSLFCKTYRICTNPTDSVGQAARQTLELPRPAPPLTASS